MEEYLRQLSTSKNYDLNAKNWKFLIFNEISCLGDLEPPLGMKSRQEFKFELEKLPGSSNFEDFWKMRKFSWNAFSGRFFAFKYSNFPCWRMCAVLRGVPRGLPTWCEALSVIVLLRGSEAWKSRFSNLDLQIPSSQSNFGLLRSCWPLKPSNLRFGNTQKNHWKMLYKMVPVRIWNSSYKFGNTLQTHLGKNDQNH